MPGPASGSLIGTRRLPDERATRLHEPGAPRPDLALCLELTTGLEPATYGLGSHVEARYVPGSGRSSSNHVRLSSPTRLVPQRLESESTSRSP